MKTLIMILAYILVGIGFYDGFIQENHGETGFYIALACLNFIFWKDKK